MCTATQTDLDIKEKDVSLYVPEKARITKITQFTDLEKLFKLEILSGRSLNHDPGQFVQVSILGIGECPISITSPPSNDNKFELGIRNAGELTNKIHALNEGDEIFIRGPFGHGFTSDIQERMHGKHVVFIAGGCGFFPLRSMFTKAIYEKDKFEDISILYGCKHPTQQLCHDDLTELRDHPDEKVKLMETVDNVDDHDNSWEGNVGVITTLLPDLKIDPDNTIVAIVGPPVMYKFIVKALLEDKKMKKEDIYVSLERRMKCGVGKCGHCKMEGIYVCQEGPVFNLKDIENNEEAL